MSDFTYHLMVVSYVNIIANAPENNLLIKCGDHKFEIIFNKFESFLYFQASI